MILIIYFPLKDQLHQTIENNFVEMCYANSRILDSVLSSLESKAISLSERLFILPDLKEYKDGSIIKDELLQRTENLYEFAVKSTRDIAFSSRYVDNEKIYTIEADENYFPIEYDKKNIDEITSFIIINDGKPHLVVYSPVYYKGEKLGVDEVVFHIPSIIEEDTIKTIFCIFSDNYFCDGNKLKFDKNDIYQVKIIEKDVYFLIPLNEINGGILFNVKKTDLFQQINKISYNSIIYVTFIVLGIIIITYFTIIRSFNKAIDEIIFEKDEIEKLSQKDPLTGIYNRSHFNNYIESFFDIINKNENDNLSKKISSLFVMIDIDHFKEINDKYGHITGDSVLKEVANAMKKELINFNLNKLCKFESYVYRYGGDEFIIFCPFRSKEGVINLIKNIINEIEKTNDYPFKIHLSFGISEIKKKEEIIDSLHKADQEMYKYKNSHNIKNFDSYE